VNSRRTPSSQFNPGTSANKQLENCQRIYTAANRNRMPGGKRGNRNRKLQSCRVIFVGSPPHNTTINTRHTAPHQPNTNHHQQPQTPPSPPPLPITATNTQHTNQAHQASPPRPPSTPSPASRPPVLLVARPLGCSFWRHFGQHRQPVSQPASSQLPAASYQQPAASQRQPTAGKPVSRDSEPVEPVN
jgi:hypothetical protein